LSADRAVERSLGVRAKSAEIKFLSLRMNFLCNFQVGGFIPLQVAAGNPISISGLVAVDIPRSHTNHQFAYKSNPVYEYMSCNW